MISRPRLRAGYAAVPVASRQLFLLGERRQVVLDGAVYPRLAPLLDGTRDLSAITAATSGASAFHEILLALGQLEGQGCLADGPAGLPPAEAAWLDSLPDGEPGDGVRSVSVRALGGLAADGMRDALAAAGFAPADAGDVEIVLADDYLRPELEELNREALAAGRAWMLVKPVGMVPWVGPIFVPGRTGCWSCLAQRVRANRQLEKYLRDRSPQSAALARSRAALPSTLALAQELAAAELWRFARRPGDGSLAGRVLSFDVHDRGLREHALVRRPQCRACGEVMPAPGRPALTSRPERFRADGGHRTLTPAETFERYQHHISPITGAVTDLRPALGLYDPELTPAYVAGHNFAMGVDSVLFLKDSLRGLSGGKGASPIQAKVSGLCEAIERYSGIWWGDEPAVRGTLRGLAPRAIHPNACMGFAPGQYAARETPAAVPPSRYELVPRPFDPEREVSWTSLWSLTHDEERLLPTAYCYYGHPEFREGWCIPDSNGCAAGNTLEEAALQGFMELVERDGVALWWYNRIRRRGIDLDSFGLPYVGAVRDHYAAMGRSLWALDLTSDLGIPIIACVSARRFGPTQDVLVGFGAHFDARVALLRAITEVNQFLPSVCHFGPDGQTIYLFGDDLARRWWTSARVEELDYLTPDPARPPVTRADYPDVSRDDLADDVRLCVERARSAGLEVLLLDQTRPDIGLSVVRVAVPGLCHFWRRLGPRRLYEVPVAQGWLPAPRTPDQMNPWTIFF